MHQLTLRIPDDLVVALKRVAAERGESINTLATHGLRALVDPNAAGSELAEFRERLAAAGLLAPRTGPPAGPIDSPELQAARIAAGRGRPLSEYVSEDREDRF